MRAKSNGGRHRKGRAPVAIQPAGLPTTRRVARRSRNPLAAAGAALVAVASLTAAAVVPAAPDVKPSSPHKLGVTSADLVLAAASSPLNIPVNFAIDLLNIPQNEVKALNYEAAGLFFTGSWWVSNATNIWGTDPGDPPKYVGAAMMLLPIPYFSTPVGKVLTAMAESELPVNSTCGTTTCAPYSPFDALGVFEAILGLKPFPTINDFFGVPLSALYTGYTFDPTAPGQQSYAGYVPTDPFGPDYDLAGTQPGPDGTYLQPWAGQTVNLTDLTSQSWAAYVDHLQADPASNPIAIPTPLDVARALTNLVASIVVSFDPFTPGMSYCPTCQWPKAITPQGIVGALSAVDPGNKLLSAWLNNHGWQASQGAPGDPTPTPSTPESAAQHQTTTQTELTASLPAPSTDISSESQQQQRRHAKPDINPFTAIETALKFNAPTTSSGGVSESSPRTPSTAGTPSSGAAGTTRSFQDRIHDAVAKAIGGGKIDVNKRVDANKSADSSNDPSDGDKSNGSGKSSGGKTGHESGRHRQ